MTARLTVPWRPKPAAKPGPDAVAFVVGLGTMFVAAHVSGIIAVFPRIISELGVNVAHGQWILTAYTLSLSACLLTFGSLADRIGLLRVYIWGMAIFGAGSGACALASDAWSLIALRVAQGVGAAMVSATSVALLGNSISEGRLGRAVGLQTGMTYIGLALGPLFAGFMVQRFGWRTLFAVNVPLAVLAISVALKALQAGPEPGSGTLLEIRRVLWPAIMWMSGVIAFILALNGTTGRVLGAVWVAVCVFFFVRVDPKTPQPLLGAWITRSRRFTAAAIDEVMYYAYLYAIGFVLPLYLHRSRGYTMVQIGIFLGSQSAARTVLAPVSGRISDRFGASLPVWLGLVSLAIAACCLSVFGDQTTPAAIYAALMLLGVGAGLFAPANSKALLCAAPAGKHATSTGILATARNVGMTLGVALSAVLYSSFGGDNHTTSLYAVRETLTIIAAIAILHAVLRFPFHAAEFQQPIRLTRLLAQKERIFR